MCTRGVEDMFGYIRGYKPYMRVYEFEIYRSIYCGICKDMHRRFGFFTRFTLSYDAAFLALMDLSVHGRKLIEKSERCIAHPWKKTMCAGCENDLSYASDISVLLTYHKLRDDFSDKGFGKKMLSALALPFFKKPYKKACAAHGEISKKIAQAMKLQNKIEKEKTAGIDAACEPTALMMQAVFEGIGRNSRERELLRRFGYCLGRYIYVTDALDDLKDDIQQDNYNPLRIYMQQRGIGLTDKGKVPGEVKQFCDWTVNMSLGVLAESYYALGLKRFRDILDNIIYLGLKNTYSLVKEEKFNKRNKPKKGKAVI